jgi:hypothetical protein
MGASLEQCCFKRALLSALHRPRARGLSGTPISWNNTIYTGSGWKDFHNVQHSSANVTGGKVFNTSVFDTRTVANSSEAVNNNPLSATFNPDIQPNAENYRTFPQYLLRRTTRATVMQTCKRTLRPGKRPGAVAPRSLQPA